MTKRNKELKKKEQMNKYKKIKRECKKLENRKNQRKILNESQVKFFLFIIKNDIK